MQYIAAQRPAIVALPQKSFQTGLGRLEGVLEPQQRARLSRTLADRVADACVAAGAETVVVTSDEEVAAWADQRSLGVLADPPGGGLTPAAEVAAETAMARGLGWCIVHGDLPLLCATDIERFLGLLDEGAAVLAPSRDGGTNLLAALRPIGFRYGPGSFARHLVSARRLERRVLVTAGTVVELDTPADLYGTAQLAAGAWLAEFLS